MFYKRGSLFVGNRRRAIGVNRAALKSVGVAGLAYLAKKVGKGRFKGSSNPRKALNKKSSFQNVKVEGNGGQISRTTMGAKSRKSRWLTTFKKIGTSQYQSLCVQSSQ